MPASKGKAINKKFFFHNFEVVESFVEILTTQNNKTGIILNNLRLSSVKIFQMLNVNKVVKF
jgi:hypothetical protein